MYTTYLYLGNHQASHPPFCLDLVANKLAQSDISPSWMETEPPIILDTKSWTKGVGCSHASKVPLSTHWPTVSFSSASTPKAFAKRPRNVQPAHLGCRDIGQHLQLH